jgi:small subunit ribosomal protein S16
MATRIRLRRMGAKKRPYYRVVVADQRAPRDGRFIENIGKYHPLEDPSLIEIDEERALHWLRTGAQPSEQVQNLMTKIGIWEKFAADRPRAAKVNSKDKKVREGKPDAPKTSKKAQAKAAEAATEAAAPVPRVAEEPTSADGSVADVVEASRDEPAPTATPEAEAVTEE